MLAYKLIHYFSNHSTAFGFQVSTQPDNIRVNAANRKTDQNILDFPAGISMEMK